MENHLLLHYIDNKWVDENELKLSIFDITIMRGFGVFDFLRTYNKKPFGLKEHVERLFYSANEIGINPTKTKKEIYEIIQEGIKKSPYDELYIKLYFTGGVSSDAITPTKSVFICIFLKANSYPLEMFAKGIKMITYEYERFLPKIKSLNYMAAVISLQKAKKQQAQDALFISKNGNILEGTTVNFFGILDGKLYTPKDDILYGITRNFLIKIAKEARIEVIEQIIPKDYLSKFQEVFITSTTKEVMPVIQIDNIIIGNGNVGPITKKLIHLFSEFAKNNQDMNNILN